MTGAKYPEFRKRLGPGWWLSNRRYAAYMLRELSSLFISIFCLLYVYQLSVLASGNSASYASFLGFVRSPFMVGFSVVILGFCLYHALTWFYLIGKVQPIKMGRRTTSPFLALVINGVLLLAVSFVVVSLFLVGR